MSNERFIAVIAFELGARVLVVHLENFVCQLLLSSVDLELSTAHVTAVREVVGAARPIRLRACQLFSQFEYRRLTYGRHFAIACIVEDRFDARHLDLVVD